MSANRLQKQAPTRLQAHGYKHTATNILLLLEY